MFITESKWQMLLHWLTRIASIKKPEWHIIQWVGQVDGHLVSKCLSQVQLSVLSSLSLGTCTLKKLPGPTIYPSRDHLSQTIISFWLKILRIHHEKPKYIYIYIIQKYFLENWKSSQYFFNVWEIFFQK